MNTPTNTPNPNTKLIAIYARVSTTNQENEGTIETQIAAVKEYAQKNSLTIVQEYLDNGWSGDSIIRPALDQLRIDAKKKIWEGVLIYDPDRLARRYSYQELVLDELREAGIAVLFVTTPQPKDETDRLLYGVKGIFAEYERAKISERFRIGKVRKVREGHVLTTVAPYGYRYVPNVKISRQIVTHGYYEKIDEEARVVRMIFNWVANDGLTIRKIVHELEKHEIKPRKSKRGVWSTSTLSTLLRNRAYIGEAHWGSSYAVVPEKPFKVQQYKRIKKTSRRMRPLSEWTAAAIPVPVIIDKALFEKAGQQLKANYALCIRNKKNQYLLAGKIRCICGRTRTGEGPLHGKHLYYRCSDRVLSFPLPPTCRERGINARVADALVWKKLTKLMSSPAIMQAQMQRWGESQHGKVRLAVGDTKSMQEEILKLQVQEDRYNKAFGAGLITMSQLESYTTPVKEKIASLERQIIKTKQQENQINDGAIPGANDLQSFSNEAIQALPTLGFELKRAIVANAVSQIIGTQQKLEVCGKLKLDLFTGVSALSNHVEYETSNRHRRPAQCR